NLIEEANEKLDRAEHAFNEGKYGEAFGQANAAMHLAINAKRILTKTENGRESRRRDLEEFMSRTEVRIIIDRNSTLSEARVRARFIVNSSDKDVVVNEIISRFHLTVPELLNMSIPVEFDEVEERDPELDVSAERGRSSTRVDIKLRFTTNTTIESEVLEEIEDRTELTRDQVLEAIEFSGTGREGISERGRGRNEREREQEEEHELDIDVEIEGDAAFVKVEVGDAKSRFILHTEDVDEIIQEIALRTGLSEAEVREVIEIEREGEERGRIEVTLTDKESCEAVGGDWGRIGLRLDEICNLPTSDAGKKCTDSDQCEGSCIGESEDSTSGTCTAWTITVGCHAFVEDGKVRGILCVD
ncbi:MAG: hypothetical protein AABX59_01670, partial [Nanoarchaeota archaeon]